MKVRAKMPASGNETCGVGYYGLQHFRGGEIFELSDPAHFSWRWMEKVETASAVPVSVDLKGKKGRAAEKDGEA